MSRRHLNWSLGRVLFETARPAQLLLIFFVYLYGAKVALFTGASLSAQALVSGALVLLLTATSVHQINEYADYETDARTDRTAFSGGSGALQRFDVSRTVTLRSAAITLSLGIVLAVAFALRGVLSVRAVGVLAVIAVFGWQYSVGPLKLAWRGWGELDNAVLGGLVLPVYGGAVVEGTLQFVALASIPFFLVVLLNLFATQWPDRAADRAVGKRTLAVQWPPTRLRRVYIGVALLAGLTLMALAGRFVPMPVALASLPVVPLVGYGAYGYTRRHRPWPTVAAMVTLLFLQTAGWCWVTV